MRSSALSVCFLSVIALSRVWGQMPAAPEQAARSAHIALVVRTDRDSVVLRWGPSTAGGWITANRSGYIVERVTMTADGGAVQRSLRRLTPAPLMPWPLEEWRRRASRGNTYAAIAAQALYGKSFVPAPLSEKGMSALRNAADELTNRFGFAMFAADNDALAAEGLGLRSVDKDVTVGERYLYRVFPAAGDPTYSLDTAYALVTVAPFETAPPPVGLKAAGFDGRIELEWADPELMAYTGYLVSRSEDNGRTFRQMTATPLVSVTPEGAAETAKPRFIDTAVVNYRRYQYQVVGVTPFAEHSRPATVETYGRDLTPPAPPLVKRPQQVSKTSIVLEWDITTPPSDLSGFVIARSANSLVGFEQITPKPLPPGTRRYVDVNATEDQPYYIIGAVDTAGNVSPSLPVYSILIDSLPPSVPKGLTGTIDTNGVVRLRWRLGPEKNLLGYRVLWANDPDHEFSQATPAPVRDTLFADTVNVETLTRFVYFRVAAVNTRYAHSEMSPILALRRPDRNPPEAPVFHDYAVTDTTVTLSWFNSSSEDVAYERMLRRVRGGAGWDVVATLRRKESTYTDHGLRKGEWYEYRIVSVDSSGLVSPPARSIHARPVDDGSRPAPRNVRAVYNPRAGTVGLTWESIPPGGERHWFVVYRAFREGGLIKHASVAQGARSYLDRKLVGTGTYKYAVRLFTAKGGESVLSSPVEVQVR